ncbi:MAG: T9SS type A sorting domain-containing protein [Crocinitomicaceae bacterium]|nr:T9SS type A sorting domain-containing protein [Flavobacteriales bacterium]NQZ38193.1 T9SS type A sorting domain-containing protein [Crocinitomicaceae bacterium]
MKNLILSVSILISTCSIAQTILFEEDFESTLDPFFQLNSGQLNGATTSGLTKWVVDDLYTGGIIEIQNIQLPFPMIDTIPDTPNQPAGIAGGGNSNYLHMSQQEANTQGVMCASYIWTSDSWNVQVPSLGSSYFTRTQGINTMGMTDVTLSFWWLGGLTPSYGEIYYSLNAGNTWILVQTGMGDQATWTEETITDPAWDNLAGSIWFGFHYLIASDNAPGGGYLDVDTGFSIDDIKVTANSNGGAGIQNIDDQTVSIYPNPASSQIKIELDEQIEEVLVFDMYGTLVQTESTNSFSIEALSSGIYSIHIKTSNGLIRKRFIKE